MRFSALGGARVSSTIDAHSVYVQFLIETGVIGLAACLWLYARVVAVTARLILRGERWAWMRLAMIAGCQVMADSDTMLSYPVPTWYMWFVLGGACAVLRQRRSALPLPA